MADIEIVSIHNNPAGTDLPSKLNDEYIVIRNKSDKKYNMVGWIVSDRTPTGKETHLFRFPEKLSGGSTWTFDPGEYIFLMTGRGTDTFIPKNGDKPPQFHFYMNRDWFVWNNSGDTAYLRLPNGEFVHWMKVP
jgi:hypothetical protein